jgi:putative CocE/NonD family hydrolase
MQASPERPGRRAQLLDRLTARLLQLPCPLTDYQVHRALPVTARDGVTLLTDVYEPVTSTARGTVLMRGPYGLGFPADLLQARILAGQGYHVVNQSCRGTFGSGGEFDPFINEFADGQDTMAWLRAQPWFDGRLATFGTSYLAWTQWALLTDPPPELRTAMVTFGLHDFADFAWGSGAFTLNDLLAWSESVVNQERFGTLRAIQRQATVVRRIRPAVDALPLTASAERVLGSRAPWFRHWVEHPDPSDPFWCSYRATAALERTSVPVMILGGWQDIFLGQTFDQYRALRDRGIHVGLTVGPWAHARIGLGSIRKMMQESLDWLAVHLAGDDIRTRKTASVQIFVGGSDEWRQLEEWPPPAVEHRLQLQEAGRLAVQPSEERSGSTFVYDPADPTPSVGGRLLTVDAGVKDNRDFEARPDVLIYTTEPLTAPLEIVGTPVIKLDHSSDNSHADLAVRLCDVDPKGRSRNFCDGYLRLDPARDRDETTVELILDPCAYRLAVGHRLRLQIAGGAHPHYGRNEGTGEAYGSGANLRTCTHTIRHGGVLQSFLSLPTTPSFT